ncbi:DP-EP family protein [Shewanella mangrovi]|uniref:DP-EP family protein n=1 Tax=Shewanella mangrovi TaxID=1515746 RepID=UPI00069104A3|nr:DP-EP family protein [Shewanella mangrovi]
MIKSTVDTYTFDVKVIVDSNSVPVFNYYAPGSDKPLTSEERVVTITGPSIIFYKLIETEFSPAGLKFVGAGFKTPFDGVIENVYVSDNGDTLVLEDLCVDTGTSNFQLLLKTTENNLTLMSPDPQVINKKK